MLTKDERFSELRIDLRDFNNETRFAQYKDFSVGPCDDKYRLRIGEFHGDAGMCTSPV
jgi:hypothetical protein